MLMNVIGKYKDILPFEEVFNNYLLKISSIFLSRIYPVFSESSVAVQPSILLVIQVSDLAAIYTELLLADKSLYSFLT